MSINKIIKKWVPTSIKLKPPFLEAEFKPIDNESQPRKELPLLERGPTGFTWEQYAKLFNIEGYTVSYIPILNDWKKISIPNDSNRSTNFLVKTQFESKLIHGKFSIPNEFREFSLPPNAYDGRCCRLSNYSVNEKNEFLSIELQETSYFDYLRSGEQLNAPFPSKPSITNREAFGKLVERGEQLCPFTNLTNICGVGVLIRTSDDYIIFGKIPQSSHVYPGRFGSSAAGVMKWEGECNPFQSAAAKCNHKIRFRSDISRLKLVTFGVDAKKLYFQFSFIEETMLTSDAVIANCEAASLFAIPFNLEMIINKLFDDCWEPASEAALLTLSVKEFGPEEVRKALISKKSEWSRREMKDEWDYRASRPGDLPDMSLRYERTRLESESLKYVNAVIEFMGSKINGANIVEVGCGTGRITERLLQKSSYLKCVEFCDKMIERSKARMENRFDLSRYAITFAQEYFPQERHDAAVCSLVLIHNVDETDYRQLVKSLCRMAKTVYVFEDISISRKTSPRTVLRSVDKIEKSFSEFGFTLSRQKRPFYRLFDDEIAFLEFNERNGVTTGST